MVRLGMRLLAELRPSCIISFSLSEMLLLAKLRHPCNILVGTPRGMSAFLRVFVSVYLSGEASYTLTCRILYVH